MNIYEKRISTFISFFYLICSILLIIYIVYRSEFHHSGVKFDYYFKYYFISILFLIFAFISFFLKYTLKINSIIFLTSVLIGLYIIEFTIFYKNKYDSNSNGELYYKLKDSYEDLVVRVPPNIYLLDKINYEISPLSGISKKNTLLCKEYDDAVVYKSDRYGFNNPDRNWDEEQIEYLIVGDSYAHGDCVESEYNIAGNLEKISNRKVINLGYGGNGPIINYASLREYLPLINVKNLIWIYYEGNDLDYTNIGIELKSKIFVKYLKDLNFTQNLSLKQIEIDLMGHKKFNEELKKNDKKLNNDKYNLLKLFNIRYLVKNFKFKKKHKNLKINSEFKRVVLLTKNLADQSDINFYFVYVPSNSRYINKINILPKNFNDYQEVISYLKKLNIPLIDLHEVFFDKKINPKLKRTGDYHYTKEGYKVISKYLEKFILNNKK
jgi:hypothetical protein